MDKPNIRDMVGKIFTRVFTSGDAQLVFKNKEEEYLFYHEQCCCESVYIDDICGDLEDLCNSPILRAEERFNYDETSHLPDNNHESYTYTFYEFATIKGSVTVRWFGGSNGYYSERVDLQHNKR